ncbi:MAG: hypothetical protein LCH46_15840 [Proteobacteria bacterium]|nr:hypothetical protein [Pseudomonadota bacterium]
MRSNAMDETIDDLRKLHALALLASKGGPPARTSNPFFGVGPISDAMSDEIMARRNRHEFEHWLEETYRKRNDKGVDIGPVTAPEIARSMHRGAPADAILLDLMRSVHRYFGFPRSNRLAIGLGGGHTGFTVAASHFVAPGDFQQMIYVDTPPPESDEAAGAGFFRQSWASQLVELMQHAKEGDDTRLIFAESDGHIPPAMELTGRGVKLFFGVGHETTGASTYSRIDVQHLINWLDADAANHHAVIDATSLLGAMTWGQEMTHKVMTKCCLFMPLQKAIGGAPGYYLLSLTPQALSLADRNSGDPIVPIPRQMKLAVPVNQKWPLSGRRSVHVGPIYDAHDDRMLGGVINTFSVTALAETNFSLVRMAKAIGPLAVLTQRSLANRQAINTWLEKQALFSHAVKDPERRGAAVTLLKAFDPDVRDRGVHERIVARTKQLMGLEGITHPDGAHEPGLDVARYINAFPGTPGDFRAWIGGIRDKSDIIAFLENLTYCWYRAKAAVAEEDLHTMGITLRTGLRAQPEAESYAGARLAAEELAAILAGLDTTSIATLQRKALARHRRALVGAAAAIERELRKILGGKRKAAATRSRSKSPSGKPKSPRPRSGKRP